MKQPKFEVNEIVILRANNKPYKIAIVNGDCTYRLFSTDTNDPSYNNGTIGCFSEGLLEKPHPSCVFEVFNDNNVVMIRDKQVFTIDDIQDVLKFECCDKESVKIITDFIDLVTKKPNATIFKVIKDELNKIL